MLACRRMADMAPFEEGTASASASWRRRPDPIESMPIDSPAALGFPLGCFFASGSESVLNLAHHLDQMKLADGRGGDANAMLILELRSRVGPPTPDSMREPVYSERTCENGGPIYARPSSTRSSSAAEAERAKK